MWTRNVADFLLVTLKPIIEVFVQYIPVSTPTSKASDEEEVCAWDHLKERHTAINISHCTPHVRRSFTITWSTNVVTQNQPGIYIYIYRRVWYDENEQTGDDQKGRRNRIDSNRYIPHFIRSITLPWSTNVVTQNQRGIYIGGCGTMRKTERETTKRGDAIQHAVRNISRMSSV
jgi:hypothetical protein